MKRRFKEIYIIAKYDVLIYLRYPMNLLWLIMTPFVFAIVGMMLVPFIGKEVFYELIGGSQSGVVYVLAGYAVFAFANVCYQCNSKIETEIVQGTAKTTLSLPIRQVSYIYGLCLSAIVTTGGFSIVIFCVLMILYPTSWLKFLIFLISFFLIILQYMGIALIVSSISLAYKRIGGLSNIITFCLQIVTGFIIPLRSFPKYAQCIFSRMPTAIAIDCIRSSILDLNPMYSYREEILWLLIYAVSLNVLGNILCRKALMKIKITGSLDTY